MQQPFVGLTMPVFTAFGWAGEEQALNFALSQLEDFISRLHAALPRRLQTHLPFFGLNRESQIVYLAANQEPEKDVYIGFITRPMSLELQLAANDEMAVGKALKAANADPERWRQLLGDLGEEWTLHIKQMQVDEDSGERASYQDLYKDSVANLDAETAEKLSSRAYFLHGEPQWITPFYVSHRYPAEQIATMGIDIIGVMVDQLRELLPLLEFLTGKTTAPPKKTRKKTVKKAATRVEDIDPETQFVYVTRLKPLHIRRGFVNLTPAHWPFFARTARSTTRAITVGYDDHVDKNSSVWRLSSNDMARIVLSDAVRFWLEDTFEPDDKVQVTATKLDDDEIEVVLEPVA